MINKANLIRVCGDSKQRYKMNVPCEMRKDDGL